jgi:antitoxin HicB
LDARSQNLMEGVDFPPPSKAKRREHLVAPPAETVAKAALYVAMRQEGISKVQVAKRLGVDEKEVRRHRAPRMQAAGLLRRGR